MKQIKKVLLLGSGALKIGEAGEFDYSGSQALKAFKEEGVEIVLVNPNIATIQTSKNLADKIYFLPVNPFFVEQVIKKEKPDAISLSFGGQTALNCGLALDKSGVLKKYNVTVLGTPVRSIEVTEDRELFAKTLKGINVKVAKGGFAKSLKQANEIAKQIGFPIIIRSAFALGGLGSSVVFNQKEFEAAVNLALKKSPQISVEEYLKHWKEIEYEVVRDASGNKITVCNMENFDPLGIHTGESIVVAPSQTLNNYQYHFLRELALKVIEHLGIVGECNIQYALDPRSNDYRVIEVNARLSRSSALASKATGYPLAYVAAKLALGKSLVELRNSVTQSTSAFFEPSLDYIVIKIPRWDLQKFEGSLDILSSEMKSVGEVMAIGRSFPEALQKAIRMLETGKDGLLQGVENKKRLALEEFLSPSTQRLFAVAEQLGKGTTVDKIYKTTGIDPWFLNQLKEIVEFESESRKKSFKLDEDSLKTAKKLGFSDKLIGKSTYKTEGEIRELRKRWKVLPFVKHIDTLAAEYPAKTNYLYLTYHADVSDPVESKDKENKAIVLGSGPYRIGSSVEFDWCSVTAVQTLKQKGIETITINCNPETVSTDYDISDKLYFEELTFERVSDIYELESIGRDLASNGSVSLILAFGGQVPNNLALACFNSGMKILGTSPLSIDQAEDRKKFSALLDKLKINQPDWQSLVSESEATTFAKKIGYPVLIRPSYVLSGSAMNIASNASQLKQYLHQATKVSSEHPVVISKFIDNAKEIEIDGVGQEGELIIYAISEHVENAGVHSGDATIVLPPQRLYLETVRQIKSATKKIIKSLSINGPFNIQFLAKDNEVKVIELNSRASRSFPFVSKVTGYNFVEMATKAMLGDDISGEYKTLDLDYVSVKAAQFSFNRIKGADPTLRVEMASTGEVACFGDDLEEAYLKALISTGNKLISKSNQLLNSSVFISVGGDKNKQDFLESAKKLYDLGFKIYATENTSKLLKTVQIKNTRIFKISESKNPSVIDLMYQGKIDLVININEPENIKGDKDGFKMRRTCVEYGIPLITNLQSAIVLATALTTKKIENLEIKSWDEYLK